MWSPKGTTLRVIRCPTLQVSQFLFPGQRSDTFLTDHVCNVQCNAQTAKCYITVSALMQHHLNSSYLHIAMDILMLAPKGVIKLSSK